MARLDYGYSKGTERLGEREARGDGLTVFEAFEGSGQLKVKFKIYGLGD